MRISYSIGFGIAALGLTLVAVASPAVPDAPPPAPAIAGGGIAPRPGKPPAGGGMTHFANNPAGHLEQVFTPLPQCSVYNTKQTTKFAVNEFRTFTIAGSTNLSSQGGSSSGCGVPSYATAVTLTVTGIDSSVDGFLSVSPLFSQNRTVSYSAGHAGTNAVIVGLSSGTFKVYSSQAANTSAVVTGYYAPQVEGLIFTGGGTNGIYSGSPAILSVDNVSTGVASVTLDRDVTFCSITTTAYYGIDSYSNGYGFDGNKIKVYSWVLDASTNKSKYTNNYVYIAVHC